MKRIILLLAMALPLMGMSQESKLNSLYEKYSGQEGYTSIYITGYMFDLFAKVAAEDEEFDDVTEGMESVKIITVSDNSINKKAFYEEVMAIVSQKPYNDFMIINDEGQEIKFMVRDEGSRIAEFVMLVQDEDEPLVLFIEGDINLANISRMSKSMEVKGFEHLEKVENKE